MPSHREPSKDAPPAYDPTSPHDKALNDAKALRAATSSIFTDKKTLIQIIPRASLNPQHMALLQQTYTTLYQRPLQDDIRGHIPSEFKILLLDMVNGPVWSDVRRLEELHLEPVEAKRVLALCEMIFCRTPAKLHAITALYEEKNSKPLAKLIRHQCSKSTAELLVKYLETTRCEDGTDALEKASLRPDVQLLHQGLWQQGKEDMETALNILARSSRERLIALLDEFEAVYHVPLGEYATEKTTGTLQLALGLLLAWTEDPIRFARDCLVKLVPVKYGAAERSAITHTMAWAHWNRTLFEAGKTRVRYTTSWADFRRELERGHYEDAYRELILKICDGKY